MSIISRVKGFKLSSGYFSEPNKFDIYDDSRIALIYGNNGSGKSTISEGFRKLNENGQNVNLEIYDTDGNILNNKQSGTIHKKYLRFLNNHTT